MTRVKNFTWGSTIIYLLLLYSSVLRMYLSQSILTVKVNGCVIVFSRKIHSVDVVGECVMARKNWEFPGMLSCEMWLLNFAHVSKECLYRYHQPNRMHQEWLSHGNIIPTLYLESRIFPGEMWLINFSMYWGRLFIYFRVLLGIENFSRWNVIN